MANGPDPHVDYTIEELGTAYSVAAAGESRAGVVPDSDPDQITEHELTPVATDDQGFTPLREIFGAKGLSK